jgi:protein-L-isoaspartate(D-aspartate) O-methyltransferase
MARRRGEYYENQAIGEAPDWDALRDRMLEDQVIARGVAEPVAVEAMRRVPRHEFVPEFARELAYTDQALPLAGGQTISQPYIVALMTELARPEATDRALDVGTGSGYQAAVLAQTVSHVDSVEIVESLAKTAAERLARLGILNVSVHCADGVMGYPEGAPYDVIVVAAAPEHVPRALLEQLAPGGRLVIPVGSQGPQGQDLLLIEKREDGSTLQRMVIPVRFVPMVGAAKV